MDSTERLNQLKRMQRDLIDASLDRQIPKPARDDLSEAEWHVSSAHHHIAQEKT